MRKRLLILDLDGVLVDSRQNMELAWARVRERFGVEATFETYFAHIGLPFPGILDRLGIREDQQGIETLFREVSLANLDAISFYPGVEDMLPTLSSAGVKLAVVTSKDATRTHALLERLSVEFEVIS